MATTSTPASPASHELSNDLESTLRENRVFPASAEFAAKAYVGSRAEYDAIYARSIADPEGFWA